RLEHHAHTGAHRARRLAQIDAEHGQLALLHGEDRREQLEQGRLAGTVGAEHGVTRAARDGEVDAGERLAAAVAVAERPRRDRGPRIVVHGWSTSMAASSNGR